MGLADSLDGFCYPVSKFWARESATADGSTIWHDEVDVTLCFEDTAILYGICCLFWLILGIKLLLSKKMKHSLPFSWLNVTKLALLVLPFLTALFDFFYTIHRGTQHLATIYQYLTPLVIAVTMVMAAVMIVFDKQLGARSSALQFLLWLSLVVYGSVKLRTLILIAEDQRGVREKFPFATFCIQFVVYVAEFILSFVPERLPHTRGAYYHLQEDERKPCPEEEALFFSKLTWWWLNGVIWRGWRSTLDYSDLSDINVKDYSSVVAPRFQKFWNRELKKAGLFEEKVHHEHSQHLKDLASEGADVSVRSPETDGGRKKKSPSLLRALIMTFGPSMAMAALFKLGQDLLLFVGPQVLRLIIRFAQDPSQPAWRGYFYAILLFVAAVVQSLLLHQYFHACNRVGMNMRTVVIAAVYRKSLRLSSQARKDKTVGEIVNLMSVDAQRLLELMTYIHILWSGPFQIIVALIFLWFTVGPAIFAGFGLMLLLIPVNAVIGSYQRKLQMKQMSAKDSRVKIVNELLNGFKVIKLYAWEKPFKKNVMNLRQKELASLRRMSYFGLISSFLWFCAPFLVTLVTFATYSLANRNNPDQRLTAERVFVSLALFNILRFPMNVFPMMISFIVAASVSLKRLSAFLKSDEMDLNSVQWNDEDAASIRGGTFTWEDSEKPVLSDIDFAARPGQLVAVVGQVGAGKSSLLSSLLGETKKLKGRVALKGSVAYVPQQAWILNATVKENIVFGNHVNSVRYQDVLHACALEPDLEVLTGGDMTEIGEKGINLSGGQKLRVSLARAVYQDADIYLMDDPLSAVDAHVGRHLFDSVLGPDGMLNDKVRVLVTHNVAYLTQCDHIVVLDNGKIAEEGTYSQLIESNGAFAEFLRTYSNVEEADETKDSDAEEVKGEESVARQPKTKKRDSSPSSRKASLIGTEKTETGRVRFSVVLSYVKACTYCLSFLTVLFYALRNGTQVGANFWLAHWSNAEDSANVSADVGFFLGIYTLFGVGQGLAVLVATIVLIIASMIGARTLHNRMLANIIRSPMSFFDTTPTGRILNRFSKDIYTIDETIPRSFSMFFGSLFTVISVLIVIMVATPVFIAVILPLGVLYVLIQRFYVAASRQLKRLESVSRSPVYSHFQESITGASSIRAYRQQQRFTEENMARVDSTNIAFYPSITINRWLAIRLEFIGTLIVFFSALFAAIQRNYSDSLNLGVNAGLIGLSISYALQVTNSLNWIVRQTSELETNIIAVERTKEYSETPTEAPAIIESHRPPRNWPSEGTIQFHHYSTRYRENLDLVLRDLNFKITGKTKVGLVGRTGAGKSSMTLALFRIVEAASGTIVVDGVDISTIGLEDLRSKLTIIPQDPVLFTGTLRTNLDPFTIYSDDELWRVLETSHLSTFVSTLEEGLEHTISEGGENLSVGQRQLVCLARALLRKSKILVLDEATAAVDLETDDLIQRTIRSEFSDCTVITIAHRINTIMDYDYVMVLQGGEILEYDTPRGLLSQKGQFYSLAKEAGLVS